MSRSILQTFRMLTIGAGVLSLAIGAAAQTSTQEKVPGGAATTKKSQLKGEVVSVSENTLVAKMIPSGEQRVFHIAPGKKFLIDGQEKTLAELQPGTVLTADVTTTETPLIERTTTVTKGKVLWTSPTSIIVQLPSGETKQYAVKPDFRFDVGGEKLTATQLDRGMELTGTKVVEEPTNHITHDAVVTGTAPK